MAHNTRDSGMFIDGTHILLPFDGSQGHGHQFRGAVLPEEPKKEEAPAEAQPGEVEVTPARKPRAKKV